MKQCRLDEAGRPSRWSRRGLEIAVWALAALLIGQAASAQIGGKLKGLKKKLPSSDRLVEQLTKDEPAITTNLEDVVTEVPFLDGYEPRYPGRLSTRWRDDRGRFALASGSHTFRAQSYCLKAGTHERVRGNGHAYAELKGPQAPIVQAILERSVAHPEIVQKNIQLLLWAIIAKAKVDDLSPPVRSTAQTLLTPEEIRQISGGALDIVSERALDEALRRLPPEARQVLQAEAELRRTLTRATISFDEAERIAIRAGVAELEPGDREIPRGRWSYHPDGYFLRLLPKGYTSTVWQIFVPDELVLGRDAAGRIVLLADALGNRVEIDYRESNPDSGDQAAVHALSRLRLVRYPPEGTRGETQEAAWQDRGWVFVGDPREATASGPAVSAAEADRRKGQAATMLDELLALESRLGTPGVDRDRALAEAIDLGHLRMGVEAVVASDPEAPSWTSETVNMILEAWQFAVCRANAGCETSRPPDRATARARPETRVVHAALSSSPVGTRFERASSSASGVQADKSFNPAAAVAQPPGSGQRIGQSGRAEENDLELVDLTPGYDPDGPEDSDYDNIPNEHDPDINGDGVPNEEDPEMDGDAVPNENDWDMDGDGRRNDSPSETDMDGDGRRNEEDGEPCGGYGCCNVPPWKTYPGCGG